MEVVTEGPTRKNVFKEIARIRSEDARVLLEENRLLGAIYLVGYSIECYLKFISCEQNEWTRLPAEIRFVAGSKTVALYTHDWSTLVEVAGILPSIQEQHDIKVLYFSLSEQWGPSLRYQTRSSASSRTLYKELMQFYAFLQETFR
jgi:hypothetical protein